jgi:hypothetical protein
VVLCGLPPELLCQDDSRRSMKRTYCRIGPSDVDFSISIRFPCRDLSTVVDDSPPLQTLVPTARIQGNTEVSNVLCQRATCMGIRSTNWYPCWHRGDADGLPLITLRTSPTLPPKRVKVIPILTTSQTMPTRCHAFDPSDEPPLRGALDSLATPVLGIHPPGRRTFVSCMPA